LLEIGVEADDAVVLEDDRVRVLDVGEDRFAQARVAGGDVLRGLDGAEEDLGLGVDAGGQLDAGDGEGGRVGRVAVDDAR
jgi:hypothetical protein